MVPIRSPKDLDNDHEAQNVMAEWHRSPSDHVTKHDLHVAVKLIMSQITDWAATEDADLTSIKATLDNLVTGIAALDAMIVAFQNSPGTLSPPDQAALDAIQAKVASIKTQSAAIDTTPPVPGSPADLAAKAAAANKY